MTAPVLAVRDLATHFFARAGTVKAVDGVSFDLAAGEILGLVGESGSGKSMTGYSLLGLIDPPGRIVAGSIKLAGQELVGLPQAELRALRGRRMAMVFQDPMTTLNPVLSIAEQIRLAIAAHERVSPAAARARAADVLGRVGIPDAARRLDAFPHQFSGGMRQRVAIAIALLHRPDLIVADEPTTALDVSIQAQIIVEVRALVRDLGTALIWISHDLATVSALAGRIMVMYAGRIVEHGPIGAVLRAPQHPYTQGLLGSLPSRAVPGQDLVQIPGLPPSLAALPAGCAFRPRCERAAPECAAAPDQATSGSRGWRCHRPLGAGAA
ncbi:MAG: ABC transporter ATP-binding protein [Alphaproteobacteria bacterium]|nr:ABC transporter ATP-binding protein [Alphaproteobacteria bacterium]